MLSYKKEDVKYAQCLFIGKRQQQHNQPLNQPPPKNIKNTKLWELHLISFIFSVCVIFNNNWQSKKKEHTKPWFVGGENYGECNGRSKNKI